MSIVRRIGVNSRFGCIFSLRTLTIASIVFAYIDGRCHGKARIHYANCNHEHESEHMGGRAQRLAQEYEGVILLPILLSSCTGAPLLLLSLPYFGQKNSHIHQDSRCPTKQKYHLLPSHRECPVFRGATSGEISWELRGQEAHYQNHQLSRCLKREYRCRRRHSNLVVVDAIIGQE